MRKKEVKTSHLRAVLNDGLSNGFEGRVRKFKPKHDQKKEIFSDLTDNWRLEDLKPRVAT